MRVHQAKMVERPNENRMSIAFPVEGNSGMDGGNLVDPNRRCAVPEVEYQKMPTPIIGRWFDARDPRGATERDDWHSVRLRR
jgi:hypothetical protein